MNPQRLASPLGALLLALSLAACQSAPKPPEKKNLSPEQISTQRQQIDESARVGLEHLYRDSPEVQKKVEAAHGYGVFYVGMINAVLLVGARGPGVIVERGSGKRTYMQAVRAGTGPGVGYQKLAQVFVFESASALNQFKVNNSGGLDVSASGSLGTANKQVSFNPDITVYQVNEAGFALQANWGGTAYFVDPDLNDPEPTASTAAPASPGAAPATAATGATAAQR